jgi:hypothetical protein
MSKAKPRGIERNGLDTAFDTDETLKSNLILQGQMLIAQQQTDAAADRFAQAAEIEERLSNVCAAQGLHGKSWVHLFSAASCWARAGNFHEAIGLCEQLLSQTDLPSRLRERVLDFSHELRRRRIQWTTGLAVTSAVE